jgi:HEAT repeats
MPRIREADAIERAFSHAWIVDDLIPDEEREARMRAFQQWWGSFEIDAFKHTLQEGNEADRLVALFALGYLAYEETQDLLVPFLASPVRKERWASAMVLGEHQDERAFALLGQLLTDHLEPFSPAADEDKVRNMVYQAKRRVSELYGPSAPWERFVHPGLVQAWGEIEGYRDEYTWYLRHRQTITTILAAWNDPRAVPTLREALQTCWHIEQRTSRGSLQLLHQLEDQLASTLGQLEAWDALDGLDTAGLPPSRFKLARMFLVFGALRVNLQHLYQGDITLLITIGTIDADQVTRVLRERFGLDEYLAKANLNVFQQWYQERDELWQWQRRLEQGKVEGLSWPPQPFRGEWTDPQEGDKLEDIKPTPPGEQPPSRGPVIRKWS